MPRDKSIDALRGLAITLVVAGHAIPYAAAVRHSGPGLIQVDPTLWVPMDTATNVFFSLFYAFHMPLFAFVSGVVAWPPRKAPLGLQLLRRARGLLLPFFAWSVVFYAMGRGVMALASPGLLTTLTDAAIGRGGLWFLYALFICAAAVTCLIVLPGSRWLLPVSAVLAIIFSSQLLFRIPDVMYLDDVFWIYPFFVLGYLSGPYKAWLLEHRRLIIVIGVAAFIPLFYLRYPVHVPARQPIEHLAVTLYSAGIHGGFVFKLLVRYLCAAAAILALYGLYLGRTGSAMDSQAWLGRKSLGIYALHGALLWWLIGLGVINALGLVVLTVAASAALTELLERIPVLSTVLLGRALPTRRKVPPDDRPGAVESPVVP